MRLLLAVAVLLSAPVAARAQAVPLDPQVKVGRLANGFTYYLRRFPHPAGEAQMRLVVKAGQMHADPDQREFPHLLEHMAFNGGKNFPGNTFREFMNDAGLQGRWNGATGSITHYELLLPANRPEIYDSGFLIMRDWAQGLTLDPAQVDAERGVVLAEMRSLGDGGELRLTREMNAVLLNHPLYPRDVIRLTEQSLRQGKQAALERFYRDWYRPDLQMLAVVGDIDVAQAEAKINALFSDMKMPTQPRSAAGMMERYEVPLTGENHFVTLADAGLTGISIRMFTKARSRQGAAPVTQDDFRVALVDDFYNIMVQRRLLQLGARYGAPSFSAQNKMLRRAFQQPAAIDALFTYLRFERAQDVEKGVRATLGALEQVKRHGFTDSEFEQARAELRERLSQPDEPSSSRLALSYVWNFATGAAAPAPGDERALRLRLLEEIALADVNGVAREWIRTDRDFDVVFMSSPDARRKLPSQRQFQAWIDETEDAAIEPYVVPVPLARLMSQAQVDALADGNIQTTAGLDEIGAVRLTLGNGITVILKPCQDEVTGSQVQLTGFRAGGVVAQAVEDRASARALAAVIANSGIGSYDKFELRSFLEPRSMRADVSVHDRMASFTAAAPNSHLESLMQLMHLYFTAPRKDPVAFADWQDADKASRSLRLSGDAVFRQGQEQARFTPSGELAGAVDFERVHAIYRDRFLQPGDFTFVITGDFAIDQALPLVRKYLATLPSSRSAADTAAQSVRAPRLEPLNRTIRAGSESNASFAWFFSGRFTDSAINSLKLELLASAIQLRLHERLRERESGTYGVSVNPEIYRQRAAEPGVYSIGVYFETTIADAQRMEQAAREEIARLGAEGLDEKLYAGVLDAMRQSRRLLLGRAMGWDQYLVEQLLRDADPGETLKREAYLNRILTRDDLNAAAREYIGASVAQTFTRLPESRRASH